jgi:hypothetical protein
MSDYFTKKVICGNCKKSRIIRGNVQMHQSRTNWEAFIRKNGVSPCPCRLQAKEFVRAGK